jgi:hypothetical protein
MTTQPGKEYAVAQRRVEGLKIPNEEAVVHMKAQG